MKEGAWHIILLIAIIGSTLLLFNAHKSAVVGYPSLQRDTISVTGQAELDVAPDEAYVVLVVETEGASAKETQDTNAQISDQVIKAIVGKGVKKDQIDTIGYSLYKREGYDPKTGKPFSLGYQQTHTMKITVKDVEKTGDVIDAAIDAGSTRIQDIRFGLSREKQKEANGETLELAAENAREKAQTLTRALNVNLGEAITISETNYIYAPPQPYYEFAARAEAGMAKTEVLPQDVTLSLTVNVVFEIK